MYGVITEPNPTKNEIEVEFEDEELIFIDDVVDEFGQVSEEWSGVEWSGAKRQRGASGERGSFLHYGCASHHRYAILTRKRLLIADS